MKKYSFDIRLNAAVTVEARSGQEALEMVRKAFDWQGGNPADCNGGAWPNGDPILFEASLSQRPDITMIDGEARRVSLLPEWSELAKEES